MGTLTPAPAWNMAFRLTNRKIMDRRSGPPPSVEGIPWTSPTRHTTSELLKRASKSQGLRPLRSNKELALDPLELGRKCEALLHGFPNQMELVTLDPSAQKCPQLSPSEPNFSAAEPHKCQSLQRESQSPQERRPPRYRPGRLRPRPVLLLSATARGTEFPFLVNPAMDSFAKPRAKIGDMGKITRLIGFYMALFKQRLPILRCPAKGYSRS